MPIAPSRACEWCMGSTWCHLSGFYGLEELTNLRYIHIIYNLNCPESQLPASPYLRKKGALWQWGCATSLRTEQCCWCTEHPRAAAVSCFFPLCLAGLGGSLHRSFSLHRKKNKPTCVCQEAERVARRRLVFSRERVYWPRVVAFWRRNQSRRRADNSERIWCCV